MPNHIRSSYIGRGYLPPQMESWKQDFTTSHFQDLPLLGLPPCLKDALNVNLFTFFFDFLGKLLHNLRKSANFPQISLATPAIIRYNFIIISEIFHRLYLPSWAEIRGSLWLVFQSLPENDCSACCCCCDNRGAMALQRKPPSPPATSPGSPVGRTPPSGGTSASWVSVAEPPRATPSGNCRRP